MEGDLQKTVGDNLRLVREGLGLTQEQMADHIGHHRTYIGGLERGERNLTLRTVERLSEALHLTPLDLLTPGGAAAPPPRPDPPV